MARSRTTIVIDDGYVQTIMDRFGVRTKTEAVDLLRVDAARPRRRSRPVVGIELDDASQRVAP